MPVAAYLESLDWTARQLAAGKQGSTPTDTPAIFEHLQIRPEVWCKLVSQLGQLFSLVAGKPQCVDDHRSRQRQQRFYMPAAARELLSA